MKTRRRRDYNSSALIRTKVVALVLLSMGVVQCAHTSLPQSPTILVIENAVRLRQQGGMFSFGVLAIIKNNGRQVMVVDRCGPVAERRIASTWRAVFYPTCLPVRQTFEIAQGDSALLPVTISGIGSITTPTSAALISPGLYRLIFPLGYKGSRGSNFDEIPRSQRTSQSFLVVPEELSPTHRH